MKFSFGRVSQLFGRVSKTDEQEKKSPEVSEEPVNVWRGSPEDHYVLTCLSLRSDYVGSLEGRKDSIIMRAINSNSEVIDPAYILERAEALGLSEVKSVWDRLRELQSQKPSIHCKP